MERIKLFPIQGSEYLPTIPWDFAETFRAQAEKNHRQSLEKLSERGGLSVYEAWVAFKGLPLFPKQDIDEEYAFVLLQFNVEQWQRRNSVIQNLETRVEELERALAGVRELMGEEHTYWACYPAQGPHNEALRDYTKAWCNLIDRLIAGEKFEEFTLTDEVDKYFKKEQHR